MNFALLAWPLGKPNKKKNMGLEYFYPTKMQYYDPNIDNNA